MDPAPDFVAGLGRPFLAHRLRRASEMLLVGYSAWLPKIGVTAPPRSLSMLILLGEQAGLGVTDIAAALRLTHPLIIRLVRELRARDLVSFARDPHDARRRIVSLTPEGRRQLALIHRATAVMDEAYRDLGADVGVDLLAVLEAMETACARERFADRLRRLQVAARETAALA